ncbi:hypothetical protein CAC42_233 [Sphaceloma murrayae]|uniref:Membrane insertase YidC/Oxa/ALB C-terminal domain-containing protein n=1 Tax=Sphaceloma murrayae TaxID=2082308 RepID=A0A2K1QNJ9_9PEZI|nr:hypothetical protein CAC42_233 [Sphaceloma murrayae]
MMPSRGAQLVARSLKASEFQLRASRRLVSNSTRRAFTTPTYRPVLASRATLDQKRSISWSPSSWLPTPGDNKPFTEAHHTGTTIPPSSTPAEPSASIVEAATTKSQVPAATESAQTVSEPNSPPASDTFVGSGLTDINTPDPTLVPLPTEQIGYLKSLGLDYGWGPTSVLEWVLEHVHVYTGLPWWSSIVISSVALRLLFFPLLMRMSDTQARMAHIKPKLDEYNQQMLIGYRTQDMTMAATAQQNMQNLRLRAGVTFVPMIANVSANMVFAVCALKLLRNMSSLPVPGMLNGGAFWFTDLTVADPYYLLPAVMAVAFHVTLRLGTEPGMDMYKQGGVRTFMLYGIPALIFGSMAFFSAGTVLWLGASGLVSIVLGRILQNPTFRDRYGLMQTPKPGQGAPGQGFMNLFTSDTTETSKKGKTIDVPSVKQVTPSGAEYQAPRVRTSAASAAGAANGASDVVSAGGRTGSIKSKKTVARHAVDEKVTAPSKSMLERYVEWGSDKINTIGEGYASAGRGVRDWIKSVGGTSEKQTSTRSKEYLKRAEQYEKRVQREKDMKKGGR